MLYLYKDIAMRKAGKSTRLLKKAIRDGCDILTYSRDAVAGFLSLAAEIGCRNIYGDGVCASVDGVMIAPITSYVNHKLPDRGRPFLVDEIGLCMECILGRKFAGYTESVEGLGFDEERAKKEVPPWESTES